MATKIKIKIGNVEVEYEGPESFLNKKLTELVANVAKVEGLSTDKTDEHDIGKDKNVRQRRQDAGKITSTTNSIAAKLKCKSGPDLILAAAARLTLAQGKASFKRQELAKETQSASTYYKKSYAKNLSQNLSSLIKSNKLNENATDTYSLTAETKSEIEKKLA